MWEWSDGREALAKALNNAGVSTVSGLQRYLDLIGLDENAGFEEVVATTRELQRYSHDRMSVRIRQYQNIVGRDKMEEWYSELLRAGKVYDDTRDQFRRAVRAVDAERAREEARKQDRPPLPPGVSIIPLE
jgi:hypothetical protein